MKSLSIHALFSAQISFSSRVTQVMQCKGGFKLPTATAACCLLFFLAILITQHPAHAQVSIGDSVKATDQSAVLELFATDKGFLLPRLTTSERDSIANPAEGLIVYDTDLNKLLYYHNGWKNLSSVWSSRDTSGSIFYDGGKIYIGPGSATDSMPWPSVLNIFGTSPGISTHIIPDSGQYGAHHFGAELSSQTEFSNNVNIYTVHTGNADAIGLGLFSLIEGEGNSTVALGGQAMYNGSGGDLNNLEDIPKALGAYTDVIISDSTAEMIAIGSSANAESSHKGFNIGNRAGAASAETYSNIGIVSEVNFNDSIGGPLSLIRDSFPTRFTTAALFQNFSATGNDYNLFAQGAAKSYFGGNVGVGKLNPAAKLDVAGAVNASAYLLSGDTIAVGNMWSQSGNDIYYDAGKVHVGAVFPSQQAASFNVMGDALMASDTGAAFPMAIFAFNTTQSLNPEGWHIDTSRSNLWFGIIDSIGAGVDTQVVAFSMGRHAEDGNLVSTWSSLNTDGVYNYIGLGNYFEDVPLGIWLTSGLDDQSASLTVLNNEYFLAGYGAQEHLLNFIGMNDSIAMLGAFTAEVEIDEPGFPFLPGSSVTLDTLSIVSKTKLGSDSTRTVLTTDGFGINTDSPDTELHVNGNVKQKITTEDVSNPPTDTELDNLFTSPASKGDGWTAYVKDSNSDNLYQIMVVGNAWYIVSTTKAQ